MPAILYLRTNVGNQADNKRNYQKFSKLGYLTLSEAENDRRNKIIRFTPKGYEYAAKIIPPAADAEIDAMAELAKQENIAELIRLTELFSDLMKKKFGELK